MVPTLRLAVPADIPAIQRVGVDADTRYLAVGRPELADGTTIPTAAAERAIARQALLVAELEGVPGGVVGWVVVGRVGEELCVGQLSVATAFGRRGIGAALLARVVADARASGEPSVVLNTEADVPWCAPWYARRGFVVVPPDEWNPALTALAAAQEADGLDWTTRVHMRLDLRRG
jgi:GNAT superfamily N-acetyltransferase